MDAIIRATSCRVTALPHPPLKEVRPSSYLHLVPVGQDARCMGLKVKLQEMLAWVSSFQWPEIVDCCFFELPSLSCTSLGMSSMRISMNSRHIVGVDIQFHDSFGRRKSFLQNVKGFLQGEEMMGSPNLGHRTNKNEWLPGVVSPLSPWFPGYGSLFSLCLL